MEIRTGAYPYKTKKARPAQRRRMIVLTQKQNGHFKFSKTPDLLKNTAFIFVLLMLCCSLLGMSQAIDNSNYKDIYKLHIRKTDQKIKIDGELNEEVWQTAEMATDFWLKFPRDDEKARKKTEVRAAYDNQFLYIAAVCHDSLPLISFSLKRDSRLRENDGFGVVIDPMNRKANGFYFSVTAFNAQADDLLTAGDEFELTFSWDNKWYSKTKILPDRYNVEIAIPFKTLRYDKNNTVWGINFIRSDRKSNQFHTWTRVPVNFPGPDLGYLGALVWDTPPPPAGTNISFIPYITGTAKENKLRGQGLSGSFNAGADAKIALSSSLNLDLTVNPDFSQVEVDRQVTNITRFSIFFPERRNFFLENDDLFSSYGTPPVRPFYSRRIGLDDKGNTIPILGGLRLTGNVTPQTRIGLLSMQTAQKDKTPMQNYSAFTLHHRVWKRSLFKAYFFNREAFNGDKNKPVPEAEKFGRNAGGEFNYTNNKGNIQGWIGYHHSMKPGIRNQRMFYYFGGGYFGRQFTSFVSIDKIGTNYYSDMGFIQRILNYDAVRDTMIRLGYRSVYHNTELTFFPKNKKIARIELSLENTFIHNPDGSLNELAIEPSNTFLYNNTSRIEWGLSFNKVNLLFPTAFTDADPLPPGPYRFVQFNASYGTDNRKTLAARMEITRGGFYNGNITSLETRLTFRRQPKLTLEAGWELNALRFPQPYGKEDLVLINARFEYTFNTQIFWTTFFQYNTQNNNININSRLQWRYAPASDFFLVYTDNYFSNPLFKSKNRALVFKLNYWLNI
ncbi:MAG: carbohydrate binding family 9 domain-containing protein [Chitinophagaceae bacterium]|nr:carbohydrate binding family 9 domain-containing protein [Chitinophagaceae bacterium]